MNKLLKSKKPGSALLLALFAIVVLSLMGTGLLRLGLQGRIVAIRTSDEIEARCAADAGLTKALYQMNEKLEVKPWSDTVLPEATGEILANCDATFSYTVTGDAGNGYTVKSIGNSGQSQEKTIATFSLQGPFEFAIFVEDKLQLKASATVDWYNYDEDDLRLQIGTNSIVSDKIDIKNGSSINGDVVVGVNGNPDVVIKDNGAIITGDTYALTMRNKLDPVTVPQWLRDMASGDDIDESGTITASGKYEEIDLGEREVLIISGQITLYITDEIELGNSAELQIGPDSSLILYLGGDFEAKNGASINNRTADAKKLKIYGLDDCHNMTFKNSSNFYGAIYAPNANVQFDNSAAAYGAVVAQNFEQKNSASFYYDASLRDVTINDEMLRFVVKNWKDE